MAAACPVPSHPIQVVWFKRDLRVADHMALAHAAARGPVLPLYIVEPGLWAELDASGRHWAFITECLAELTDELGRLGQPLIIRVGEAVPVLEAIRQAHAIAALWSHQETGNGWTYARDTAVAAWAASYGIPWHEPRQFGVNRRLKSRNGWAQAWDRQMAEPITPAPRALEPLADVASDALPSLQDLRLAPDPCPGRQPGGRAAGLALLSSFLSHRGQTYRRAMSAPGPGAEACSRLSPHLAYGTLSMREVNQTTIDRLRTLKSAPLSAETRGFRGALTSFSGRLHWHCHFMQKLEDQPAIEFTELHPAYARIRQDSDAGKLAAWSAGQTGLPFVDACMRSLNATGWLNFRMRAMVMAVASYHLWLPWRQTGLHLARVFTDYEPGIHWPQCQMQSGTTGINTIRIYNPVKQGYDQDQDGAFVRAWVPELAAVPDRFIHEPWRWEGAGTVLGSAYPHPIVDHLAAARIARDQIWGLRKGDAFHRTADAIQNKHGSRKSGLPPTARRKPRPHGSAAAGDGGPAQLALFPDHGGQPGDAPLRTKG